jgi:hypothetical protein
MQVIYRYTSLLRSWLSLQRVENHDFFTKISTWLEDMMNKFISQHRWQRNLMKT